MLTRQKTPLLATAVLLLAGLLQGCVMVPRTVETYDPNCRITRREVILQPASIGLYHGCHGDTCAAMLVAAGVVTAASLVVSGSIAIVGNVAYWFEHQKRCER